MKLTKATFVSLALTSALMFVSSASADELPLGGGLPSQKGAAGSQGERPPMDSGFAMQANISTSPQTIGDDLVSVYALGGNLTLGYKTGGAILSVGFDFTAFSRSTDYTSTDVSVGAYSSKRSYSEWMIGPDVQFTVVHSADKRAELYGLISLGFGTWSEESQSTPDPSFPSTPKADEKNFNFRWRVAPGVRYWMHRNIAVGLAVGVLGDHRFYEDDDTKRTQSIFTPFAQLGLMGVF
jgi:hypothetical protein